MDGDLTVEYRVAGRMVGGDRPWSGFSHGGPFADRARAERVLADCWDGESDADPNRWQYRIEKREVTPWTVI